LAGLLSHGWQTEEATCDTMGTERVGKYLLVCKMAVGTGKTFQWSIMSNNGVILGHVKWFASWRQYCFNPCSMTTFNAGCLRDITLFLDRVNNEHREQRNGKAKEKAVPVLRVE